MEGCTQNSSKRTDLVFTHKMLNGTWLAYLEEVDTTAKEMVNKLIKDMAAKQGVTQELKAKDQMAWVGAMNSIKHSSEEIVLREFVYSMEVQ
ncbi:MAG: TnpV protein [Clostridia bacterium]|nr:TnpV protein [Clostridia bacterium]